MNRLVGRRVVLKMIGAAPLAATLPLAACSDPSTEVPAAGSFFSVGERDALAGLANVVLPEEPGSPGGAALGAVPYIERLLTAFDVDPPAIFADGPFSGRQPFASGETPPNDFLRFTPLDRVAEKAWRMRVDKLRALFRDGLAPIAANKPAPEEMSEYFRGLDVELRDAIIDLVSQAAFGAPEYGGNPDLAGWKLASFEGDTQPLGYSIYDEAKGAYRDRPEAPMSAADPRPDPAPMDDGTRALLAEVIAFTGGKVFP